MGFVLGHHERANSSGWKSGGGTRLAGIITRGDLVEAGEDFEGRATRVAEEFRHRRSGGGHGNRHARDDASTARVSLPF